MDLFIYLLLVNAKHCEEWHSFQSAHTGTYRCKRACLSSAVSLATPILVLCSQTAFVKRIESGIMPKHAS